MGFGVSLTKVDFDVISSRTLCMRLYRAQHVGSIIREHSPPVLLSAGRGGAGAADTTPLCVKGRKLEEKKSSGFYARMHLEKKIDRIQCCVYFMRAERLFVDV